MKVSAGAARLPVLVVVGVEVPASCTRTVLEACADSDAAIVFVCTCLLVDA